MEALEAILGRRSVRSFQQKEIEQEKLDLILEAAKHAPSAMNRQTWQFTVVKDREKIQKLAAAVREAREAHAYDMYQPEVIIITSNVADYRFGIDDNACAMENILLAAHALGLGAVWINQVRDCCDEEKVRDLLSEFGVPAHHEVYGVAALGYSAEEATRSRERIGQVVYAGD